jgi:hypothetical protein
MSSKKTGLSRMTILDAAIFAGLAAVFLAISIPLVRGACLRCQTAECARKMILAADALDLYAAAAGNYPCENQGSGAVVSGGEVSAAFARLDIDWWNKTTELGGEWNWFCGADSGTIAIVNPSVSERRMRQLDRLIDDGDLSAGMFRRYGSIYCYMLKQKGRA